jgi:hypothetical protein
MVMMVRQVMMQDPIVLDELLALMHMPTIHFLLLTSVIVFDDNVSWMVMMV